LVALAAGAHDRAQFGIVAGDVARLGSGERGFGGGASGFDDGGKARPILPDGGQGVGAGGRALGKKIGKLGVIVQNGAGGGDGLRAGEHAGGAQQGAVFTHGRDAHPHRLLRRGGRRERLLRDSAGKAEGQQSENGEGGNLAGGNHVIPE